ncbi:MAG TPA: hypothetical protein VNA30_07310, partial [Mycobacteriales bacterium]|nr:hypothetical protein [Mycobacteriales bacterium]
MRRRGSVLAVGLLAVGLVALPGTLTSAAARSAPAAPSGVVAVIDSGINPYHQVFRDPSPAAQRHPSTRFPGYPTGAQALRLTLGGSSYDDAVAADCERVWKKLKPE